MKFRTRITALAVAAAALAAPSFSSAQAQKAGAEGVNLGVAIPAATHSFTAGIVFWANQAKKDLEKAHPGLKVTVKTASGAPEQANQLQDLLTATKINTLVIFPFESAALTKPVAEAKAKGPTSRWWTVA
jgi:ribose transport system substrate-binding protein